MRARTALSLTVVCVLAACAHPASTPTPLVEADMAWTFAEVEGEGAKLAYGQPQSDHVLVMLNCQPRSGQVNVSVNASAQSNGALELISGGKTSRYKGRLEPSMGDGALVEVSAPATDPVMDSFGRTGELAIGVDGKRTALPSGQPQAARFLKSCRRT